MLRTNPILCGWHPDPCVCAGPNGWYYLVVSTFQWVPGVSCYRSRDLANWESMGGLLQGLDLRGIPDSAGIWAPDLTYADGSFWLVYTVARNIDGIFKDVENYVTCARELDGEWSEPVLLNVSGFDPALYHENGRHYVVNPQWDPRPLPGHRRFNGLILQEFDLHQGLMGEPCKILDNDDAVNGLREGPHLLRHDGWYYLACAEGGTGRRHRIRMARSRNLRGPYEVCPEPLVCAWESDARLRKAGHGNLFQGPDGSWYVSHLCSRYVPGSQKGRYADGCYGSNEAGRSVLGRETALQRVEWVDGWPRLATGGIVPANSVEVDGTYEAAPTVYVATFQPNSVVEHPQKPDPNLPCSTLWREEWLAPRHIDGSWLHMAPEGLVLCGRGSLSTTFDQALIARRQTSFSYEATTWVSFRPRRYQQLAALVCLYDSRAFHALSLGFNEKSGHRVIDVLTCDNGNFSMPLGGDGRIEVPDDVDWVGLRVRIEAARLSFWYSLDNACEFVPVGSPALQLDASILSDEHVKGWAYTGAMVGLTCMDTFDRSAFATFRSFEYRDLEPNASQEVR